MKLTTAQGVAPCATNPDSLSPQGRSTRLYRDRVGRVLRASWCVVATKVSEPTPVTTNLARKRPGW